MFYACEHQRTVISATLAKGKSFELMNFSILSLRMWYDTVQHRMQTSGSSDQSFGAFLQVPTRDFGSYLQLVPRFLCDNEIKKKLLTMLSSQPLMHDFSLHVYRDIMKKKNKARKDVAGVVVGASSECT